jgi:hypothetical protein
MDTPHKLASLGALLRWAFIVAPLRCATPCGSRKGWLYPRKFVLFFNLLPHWLSPAAALDFSPAAFDIAPFSSGFAGQ